MYCFLVSSFIFTLSVPFHHFKSFIGISSSNNVLICACLSQFMNSSFVFCCAHIPSLLCKLMISILLVNVQCPFLKTFFAWSICFDLLHIKRFHNHLLGLTLLWKSTILSVKSISLLNFEYSYKQSQQLFYV